MSKTLELKGGIDTIIEGVQKLHVADEETKQEVIRLLQEARKQILDLTIANEEQALTQSEPSEKEKKILLNKIRNNERRVAAVKYLLSNLNRWVPAKKIHLVMKEVNPRTSFEEVRNIMDGLLRFTPGDFEVICDHEKTSKASNLMLRFR